MGRHSTGKNNYSLSKGLIALLAVLLLAAAATAWLLFRGNGDSDDTASEQQECVSGDLELPVAAASKAVGERLVVEYASTQPVVRDYCVKPHYVTDMAQSAVYIAPRTQISEHEIKAAGRSSTTNEPPAVYVAPVGLAARGSSSTDTDATQVALDQIVFPTDEQPEASAIVAAERAGSEAEAAEALTAQKVATAAEGAAEANTWVATIEEDAPEGTDFAVLEQADVVFNAFPLNTTDSVTEEQSRAAQAFTDYAGKMFIDSDGENPHTDLSAIGESVWSAASPAGGKRLAAGPQSEAGQNNADTQTELSPANTIFLLDTSAAMADFNDAAADAIDDATAAITGAGHDVALWNYSSPLNEGVNKGYRANVALTSNADEITGSAQRFLNDGEPLTREAVAAAVDYAVSESSPEAPARIVLITSGTADTQNSSGLEAVKEAAAQGVTLSIVQAGSGAADDELAAMAESTATAAEPGQLSSAVKKAAGLD